MENERYNGERNDRGVPHGQGIYCYNNGNRYEGEFKDGKKNGQGIFYTADGNRYEGEFKDGKPNGQLIAHFANGDRYEGEFKDGKKNGQGIFYGADGFRYEGEFKDGTINGQGIAHLPDGTRHEGEFKEDEFIERKKGVRVVPLSIEYFEDFGESLIVHFKEKPVSFPRMKKIFDKEIDEALVNTEFITSRHNELLETKRRVEELLGLNGENSESTNPTGIDWV